MAVITISRQFGSEGTEIARRVAESLSFPLIEKDHFAQLMKQYGLVHFDQVHDSLAGIWSLLDSDKVEIVEMLNKLILSFARLDNKVILGRGAFVVLHDYVNVLHVRIRAPFSARVEAIMKRENISSYTAAEGRVAVKDHIRENFIKTFYRANINTASNFDLVVNTGRLSEDLAVQWIIDAAREIDSQEHKGRTTLDINIDPIIAKTVEEFLT